MQCYFRNLVVLGLHTRYEGLDRKRDTGDHKYAADAHNGEVNPVEYVFSIAHLYSHL